MSISCEEDFLLSQFAQDTEHSASDVTLEAANDLFFGYPFASAACHLGFRPIVMTEPDDYDPRYRAAFACRLPPLLSRCRLVLPEEAGIGLTPHSAANAASDFRRSGLLPAVTSSVAAVSGPTPNTLTRSGAVCAVSLHSCSSKVLISAVS
jgi:hypothetical protein